MQRDVLKGTARIRTGDLLFTRQALSTAKPQRLQNEPKCLAEDVDDAEK